MSSFGDFPLKGKIAVVTGAGSGINLSFAQSAVKEGARVIIADLKLTKDAEKFVADAGKTSVIFATCDVRKRAELENLVNVSEQEFGDVPDVYVAGAGIFEPAWSNFWDDTEGDGYAEVDINITHAIKLSRIAIRALLGKNKKGVVLIVGSLAGYQGIMSMALYCSTKHAIVGFVRSMADLDVLEGVKIVAVAPGFVTTPLWTDRPEKMSQFGVNDQTSILPDEVANGMVALITDGKYEGGTCLEVSSGVLRALGTWNIEPPVGLGTKLPDEVAAINYAPLRATLKKERAV